MKFCLISKYPPIEGGISSSTYWLAKSLGERGHKIHVVTNAFEVEDNYRELLEFSDRSFSPPNVTIHSTDPSPIKEANPSHIPFSKMYCEKLASLAIQTIEENDIEIIDSKYLIPYAVSGYLAKSFTHIPQVIRHGGSDVTRLYDSPFLRGVLRKVIQSADAIVTNNELLSFFESLDIPSGRILKLNGVPVNTIAFNPSVNPFDLSSYLKNQRGLKSIPVIGFIGKITHHFESKGIYELLVACKQLENDFLLLFVSNGNKLPQLKQLLREHKLEEKSLILNFFPPWQIPSILKACTCIVALEKETSPIIDCHTPITPAEALATGRWYRVEPRGGQSQSSIPPCHHQAA